MQQINKVMLIDDNTIDNFIAEVILLRTGFTSEVVATTSATQALQYLKETPVTFLPKLILLDVRMPLYNGFYFLEEFEKLPNSITKEICIIILTVWIDQADVNRALSYKSVAQLLSKPLSAEGLSKVNDALTARMKNKGNKKGSNHGAF